MEDEEVYKVNKPRIFKLEDDSLYKRYNQFKVKDIPIDDLRALLKLLFNKAAINMGKESYDAPDAAIEAILEFIYKDYGILPLYFVAMSIIQGSLGKYGPGRLVPSTVYKWLHEITMEFERVQRHEKFSSIDYLDKMDLKTYPLGTAINKKIEWFRSGKFNMDDWDRVPLKELANRIKNGLECVPEIFGLVSLKHKK